jgi:hypothetical protein
LGGRWSVVGLARIAQAQYRLDDARALYEQPRERYVRADALTGEAQSLLGRELDADPTVSWCGSPSGTSQKLLLRVRHILIGSVALVIAGGLIGWHFWGDRGEVLKPDGGPVVTVMEFGRSFLLDPLPSGWRHRTFWTRSPMTMSFAVKDGVPSMRFETHDSASMLFRSVDIELAAYPMLAWRWYIELPIRSSTDERTREGDDHPARLFLRFLTDRGEKRAMEVIWGNRLKPGDYKYIGGFPHFVADAGDERGRKMARREDRPSPHLC